MGAKRKVFSSEEDEIISKEVADKGDKLSTWKALSLRISGHEQQYHVIQQTFRHNLKVESRKTGKFTLEEDISILKHLFTNKPRVISTINTIKMSSFDNMKEVKRGKYSISQRFQRNLKPILLSYHLGKSILKWKYYFFEHLVTHNYNSINEIPWKKLESMYPAQTIQSLTACATNAVNNIQEYCNDISFANAL